MTTPNNQEEKEKFIEEEKRIQEHLDIFYQQREYLIDRSNPNRCYDLLLNNQRIEEKIRSEVRADILVEIVQDLVSFALGWLYTVQADYLHYVMCQDRLPKTLYRLTWEPFKDWFLKEYLVANPIGTYIISPRGWGLTLNIPVEISEIPSDIIEPHNIIEQLKLLKEEN